MAQNTPTPQQIIAVMQNPELCLEPLINEAWRAVDVARRLGVHWTEAEPVLLEMGRWGQIVRVNVRGTRVPRYRLLGG